MTMATCGTGCRGTFDVTLQYDVPKAQWGTLRVYFGSAMDGSPEDIRDYPVWLTPATDRLEISRPAGRPPAASSGGLLSSAGSVKRAPRSGRGAAW